ncbi:hypothetical protein ACP70R_001778 [Stipagrostis hirtigluma subsp. patula]
MDAALLSAFVDNLVSQLFSLVEDKYKLYNGFEADVTFLMRELPMITSAIDGQLLGQDEHVLRLSVEELREVAHEIEDCIDSIKYGASWEEQSWYCKYIKSGKKRKSRSQLGEEMQRLKKRLEEAIERQQRYSVSFPSAPQLAESPSDQLVHRDDLVGINTPLDELLELLAEPEGQPKQLKVISIVGFCGLGKTVLARELYNSELGKQFEERAWVSAAHGDPKKLLMEILEQLQSNPPGPPPATSNLNHLSTELSNYLTNKRYFIVIDDMRSEQWSIIKSSFPRDVSSIIVVTTKILSVANTCSSNNGYMHKMRRLDKKHSKQLFLNKACPEEYSDYSCPDSAAILKICDGQPLALTTVGQFMRKNNWPTGCECEDLCNQVRFYHLESGDETLDRMHQVLEHDYTSLPSHALKACFSYFAMFPSDHPVRSKRLMRRWLAEGFVQPTNLCSDPAAENFAKLMDQNIIQPIDVSNNMKVKSCKTYGMMHEYIMLKCLSENFITLLDNGELQPKHVRRLSLHHNSITDGTIADIDLSLVRSLIVFGKAGNALLNFGKYQLLRVLDLEECTDLEDDHLKQVCNLLLLRYLSLGSNVTSLPKEIKQLKLLETLDLRRTNIKILPTKVFQLPHLIHLFGKFMLQDKAVRGELQSITSGQCRLQTLAGFLVGESEGIAELMCHMKKLRKVKIWCESSATSANLDALKRAIQEFIHDEKDACNDPRSLSLHFDGCSEDLLKDLKAPCYLRSLKLQGRLLELPGFVTSLRRLRELCLQSTKLTANLLTALTNLKYLQYLKLIADELDQVTIKDKALPRLLCLCFVLKRPTFPVIEEGALPFLESLQLLCKDIDGLPIQFKGFKRLREVTLDGRVTSATMQNLVLATKEHPNRPKVLLLKEADPAQGDPGEASLSLGATENGTGTQVLPSGMNSSFADYSVARNGTVPSCI